GGGGGGGGGGVFGGGGGVAGVGGLIAVLAAGALWVVMLRAAGATDVVSRPMWLDEALGYRLVTDPSGAHMMRALAGGCDTHPPVYYWVLRGVAGVFGEDKFVVRAVSIACV